MDICASRLLATFHPIFRLSQSSHPPPLLCPTTITRANMFPLPLPPLYNVDSAFVSSQPMTMWCGQGLTRSVCISSGLKAVMSFYCGLQFWSSLNATG